jgi:hypothetical protein
MVLLALPIEPKYFGRVPWLVEYHAATVVLQEQRVQALSQVWRSVWLRGRWVAPSVFTVRARPKQSISYSCNTTSNNDVGRAGIFGHDGICFVDILPSLDFATPLTMDAANENAVGIPRAIPWSVHA